jgi:hypothetical protein
MIPLVTPLRASKAIDKTMAVSMSAIEDGLIDKLFNRASMSLRFKLARVMPVN